MIFLMWISFRVIFYHNGNVVTNYPFLNLITAHRPFSTLVDSCFQYTLCFTKCDGSKINGSIRLNVDYMWIIKSTEKDNFSLPCIDMIYVTSHAMPSVGYIWIFVVLMTISAVLFWFTRIGSCFPIALILHQLWWFSTLWIYMIVFPFHINNGWVHCERLFSIVLYGYGLCHKLCNVKCMIHFDLRYAYNHFDWPILVYTVILSLRQAESFWGEN